MTLKKQIDDIRNELERRQFTNETAGPHPKAIRFILHLCGWIDKR